MAKKGKKGRRRSKSKSLSLLNVAHMAVQFSNITGMALGDVIAQLINSILSGDDSFLDIVMSVIQNAVTNVTSNPIGIAVRGALIAMAYSWLKSALPSRKLFGVGKYSIRT